MRQKDNESLLPSPLLHRKILSHQDQTTMSLLEFDQGFMIIMKIPLERTCKRAKYLDATLISNYRCLEQTLHHRKPDGWDGPVS
jgi:hypothetical protein